MLSFITVPLDYCDPTNYICTASGRLDRGMDSGLCKESPNVTSTVLNIIIKVFVKTSWY